MYLHSTFFKHFFQKTDYVQFVCFRRVSSNSKGGDDNLDTCRVIMTISQFRVLLSDLRRHNIYMRTVGS